MEVKWDGSYLGSYSRSSIVRKVKRSPLDLYELRLETTTGGGSSGDLVRLRCAMHVTRTSLPCIIDELAPLYGVGKVGTHTAKFGTVTYALYRTDESGDYTTLAECEGPYSDAFVESVSRVLTFRMVMGQVRNTESSIIVRGGVPLSIRNDHVPTTDEAIHLGARAARHWLTEGTSHVVRRMRSGRGTSATLRSATQDTIHRIDGELIWFDNIVTMRMSQLA